jgi:hypothetical protein
MKDFSLFDIADFVMDEDFIRWVNLRDKQTIHIGKLAQT